MGMCGSVVEHLSPEPQVPCLGSGGFSEKYNLVQKRPSQQLVTLVTLELVTSYNSGVWCVIVHQKLSVVIDA